MSWCSPVSDMPRERPCVVLLLTPPLDAGVAEAVGLGCEEEGVPLAWDTARAGDTAHSAALRSRLDVGVLAREGAASIGVTQIPEGAWLETEARGPADWRWVGQAAARLAKGQPMPPKVQEDARAAFEALVSRVTAEILKKMR